MGLEALAREIDAAIPQFEAGNVIVTGYSQEHDDENHWIYVFTRKKRAGALIFVARVKIQPRWRAGHPDRTHLHCITTIERFDGSPRPVTLDAQAVDVACAEILARGILHFVQTSLANIENSVAAY